MMSVSQLGRYEIVGTLGRGAMGVVYKAHDPLIERTVAIKTINHAGLSADESRDFKHRFFLEAKSAGRLNHPSIVTIHDIGNADDLAYIAMELPGRAVAARHPRLGRGAAGQEHRANCPTTSPKAWPSRMPAA